MSEDQFSEEKCVSMVWPGTTDKCDAVEYDYGF